MGDNYEVRNMMAKVYALKSVYLLVGPNLALSSETPSVKKKEKLLY